MGHLSQAPRLFLWGKINPQANCQTSSPSITSRNGSLLGFGSLTWKALGKRISAAVLRTGSHSSQPGQSEGSPTLQVPQAGDSKTPLVLPTVHYPKSGNQACLRERTGQTHRGLRQAAERACVILHQSTSKFLAFINHRKGISGLLPSLSSKPYHPQPTKSQRHVTNVSIKRKPLLCRVWCNSFKYLSTYYEPNLVLGTGQESSEGDKNAEDLPS